LAQRGYVFTCKQIFLDYALFMQDLMREASITARQGGEKSVRAGHVRRVREVSYLDADEESAMKMI
jgi:putative N-acetylmannosamine-6-phosphate epimerase